MGQSGDPWSLRQDGPALLCCGQWPPITRLPLWVPCCGNVFLVKRAVERSREKHAEQLVRYRRRGTYA